MLERKTPTKSDECVCSPSETLGKALGSLSPSTETTKSGTTGRSATKTVDWVGSPEWFDHIESIL